MNHRADPAYTPLIEFQQIQVCPYCEGETDERHENTVCLECEISLEGEEPVYKYRCSHCKEDRNEAECSCEHREFDKEDYND